jgi:flagellar biosynthetic protein FlhB
VAEDLGDRTEQPTARRLSKARSRGQVAKSQDLSAAITLIASVVALVVLGGWAAGHARTIMLRILSGDVAGDALSVESVRPLVSWTGSMMLLLTVPLVGVVAIAAFVGQFVQVGPLLTAEPVKAKFSRLNPISGIQRIFGVRGAVKSGVSILKLVLIAGVAILVLSVRLEEIVGLSALGLMAGLARAGRVALELLAWLLAVTLIIGIIDYAFQRWQHRRDLRMTRQEVKEERKDMEGDPQVKSRRLRMAMEIALQRAQAKVPEADVIVANPTHFSVALRYDRETMSAPRVTVKGVDFMAMRIRHIAMAHGVPIVVRPPLARALYYHVREGHEIPVEYYEVVAEVLAYVYRLEEQAA